jgi:anaerobic magnesium-protoporphyrin IX monomethyl ester cyclase
MKILLINVPDIHVAKTAIKWEMEAADLGIFPPLGLMYLAGSLLRQKQHQVKIIDAVLEHLNYDGIIKKALAFSPDIIGLTVYTPIFYDVVQLSGKLREAMPQAKIIWGGPHTTLFPRESMEHKVVDYLFLGEAEETFPAFCDALEKNKPFDGIAGIVYRKDAAICQTGEPAYVKNIDTLALPAAELLDFRRYFSASGTGRTIATICSSRGCPFQCTFCCKPCFPYRSRSVENIVKEIGHYYDLGVREFLFFDDLFNITAKRVQDIAEAILCKEWKISWSFRGRVDNINEEILSAAKKAGCRQILFGIEDATDEGLAAIKKGITVAQVKKALALTKKTGISTNTNWIIGLPHQKTKQDIYNLVKMAIKLDSDYAKFSICIAYHGTEIFNQGAKLNLFSPEIWRDYVKNPVPNFSAPIWEQYLSREETGKLLSLCYRRFYFRPKQIMRKLMAVKSFSEFKLLAKGALTLLGFKSHAWKEKYRPEAFKVCC